MRAAGDSLAARRRSSALCRIEDAPDTLWEHPAPGRLRARFGEACGLAARTAALERKPEVIGGATRTLLTLVALKVPNAACGFALDGRQR